MTKHIPNAITCCNLISGCIAAYFAFKGLYTLALQWIVIGAVFDFFDGMSARLLGVSSPIGKELDSLADDVTFGVAPSAIVFHFLDTHLSTLNPELSILTFLPYIAFLIAAFSALRLAKFNLDERQTTSFIGLPTPANALFWGSLIEWMNFKESFEPYTLPTYYIYIVIALILLSCWLLVAELPLFALKFKHWGWKGNEVKYIFIITSVLLLGVLGIKGIAVVIAWYVILSVITRKKTVPTKQD
ncbi:MAG: CDP-alcohol phosphatidyltransferase family protein [Prevotella sp.]|nr:CDP-alcohol phosphatidyltransferase family protein [Prevotella sp.]